jgi:hypothetical protein
MPGGSAGCCGHSLLRAVVVSNREGIQRRGPRTEWPRPCGVGRAAPSARPVYHRETLYSSGAPKGRRVRGDGVARSDGGRPHRWERRIQVVTAMPLWQGQCMTTLSRNEITRLTPAGRLALIGDLWDSFSDADANPLHFPVMVADVRRAGSDASPTPCSSATWRKASSSSPASTRAATRAFGNTASDRRTGDAKASWVSGEKKRRDWPASPA